ncbi:hypothetical protein [Enterococcus hirae]|uniref:hypothetical protein n=1 Tax=Enterococcus hirae TaxID=1354 RepID=UPI0006B16689|nr:hypothetical protein [Enterococcus hirae]QQU10626.1 hypothetical protein I6I81_12355 [Enterococcus hirae]
MLQEVIIELLKLLISFFGGILVGQIKYVRSLIKRINDKKYAKKNKNLRFKDNDYDIIEKVVLKYKETGSFTMGDARKALKAASNLEKEERIIEDPEHKILLEKITNKLKKYNK